MDFPTKPMSASEFLAAEKATNASPDALADVQAVAQAKLQEASAFAPKENKATAAFASEKDVEAAVAKAKELGNSAFRDGKLAEAALWFTRGLKFKEDRTLFSNRSACYCAGKEYEQALQDAERCVYLSPGWGKVRPPPAPCDSLHHALSHACAAMAAQGYASLGPT